ncbi:hypothetical protein [Candidatus Poriferisodalis sp.]|uniref:hypothetical protein n=1 Tax=Candidatus Poriferisodalis sp. TaxID=3101277 RepID=UPI003B0115B0
MALAGRWAKADDRVLLVDADAAGSRLADRLGAIVGADYSPAERGLPSLIVARQHLTLGLLAEHCYALSASAGSLWGLFGPRNPHGARYAAGWLAERADALMTIGRTRRVVVTGRLAHDDSTLAPLMSIAPVVTVLSPLTTLEEAKELLSLCRSTGMMQFDRAQRLLLIEGACPLDDEEVRLESGLRVAAELPAIDDERVLRMHSGRRDRAFSGAIDKCAARIAALLDLHNGDAASDGALADADGDADRDVGRDSALDVVAAAGNGIQPNADGRVSAIHGGD